jgi:hypothetical protein
MIFDLYWIIATAMLGTSPNNFTDPTRPMFGGGTGG